MRATALFVCGCQLLTWAQLSGKEGDRGTHRVLRSTGWTPIRLPQRSLIGCALRLSQSSVPLNFFTPSPFFLHNFLMQFSFNLLIVIRAYQDLARYHNLPLPPPPCACASSGSTASIQTFFLSLRRQMVPVAHSVHHEYLKPLTTIPRPSSAMTGALSMTMITLPQQLAHSQSVI